MADGALTLSLDPLSLRDLATRARDAGASVERLAAMIVEREAADVASWVWTGDAPANVSPVERTDGPLIDLDDAMDAFDAALEARLARRA